MFKLASHFHTLFDGNVILNFDLKIYITVTSFHGYTEHKVELGYNEFYMFAISVTSL